MKRTLAAALLLCQLGRPQTIITNWVTAHPSFREINGQLYNTELSAKFQKIEGFCLRSFTNGITLDLTEEKPIYRERYYSASDSLSGSGNFIGSSTHSFSDDGSHGIIGYTNVLVGKTVFVRNFPRTPSEEWVSARAMPAGVIDIGPKTLTLYEFGLPHVVPVLVTNATFLNPSP